MTKLEREKQYMIIKNNRRCNNKEFHKETKEWKSSRTRQCNCEDVKGNERKKSVDYRRFFKHCMEFGDSTKKTVVSRSHTCHLQK